MPRTIPLFVLLLTLSTPPAAAQTAACPGDDWTTVRISALKSGGTEDGLRKAVADHAKWYAEHGYQADKFAFGQVMAFDRALKRRAPVKGKYVTLHWHTSDVPKDKHDAAWAAYVAEYAANSTIESTTVVCMMP